VNSRRKMLILKKKKIAKLLKPKKLKKKNPRGPYIKFQNAQKCPLVYNNTNKSCQETQFTVKQNMST
jgi:hypothetical protein